MRQPQIDVCLSPEMLHLYELKGKTVVVVDILRATSCITTALAHGVRSLIPVEHLSECEDYRGRGMLLAAEREGKQAEGFDLGNSPYSYIDNDHSGKEVVMTTTNGTLAIRRSLAADRIIIGSFLNLSTVASHLRSADKDVIILCAGWKGKVNLEDTLFAGALAAALEDHFHLEDDAVLMAMKLYDMAKDDMMTFLSNSSHVNRLNGLHIKRDIELCLTLDLYPVLPYLDGDRLVAMPMAEMIDVAVRNTNGNGTA